MDLYKLCLATFEQRFKISATSSFNFEQAEATFAFLSKLWQIFAINKSFFGCSKLAKLLTSLKVAQKLPGAICRAL